MNRSIRIGERVFVRDADGELVCGVVEFVRPCDGCNVLVALERPIWSSCDWWFASNEYDPEISGWAMLG